MKDRRWLECDKAIKSGSRAAGWCWAARFKCFRSWPAPGDHHHHHNPIIIIILINIPYHHHLNTNLLSPAVIMIMHGYTCRSSSGWDLSFFCILSKTEQAKIMWWSVLSCWGYEGYEAFYTVLSDEMYWHIPNFISSEGALRLPTTYDNHPSHPSNQSTYSCEDDFSTEDLI